MGFNLAEYAKNKKKKQASPTGNAVREDGGGKPFSLADYARQQKLRNGGAVELFNTWLTDTSNLSSKLHSDYSARSGMYQNSEDFRQYRSGMTGQITGLQNKANWYRKYFTDNRADYDEDTYNQIMQAIDENEKYLLNAQEGLNHESNYWSKFKNEDEYNEGYHGNIDLTNRPRIKNADGSISTIDSTSFYDDRYGKEVVIPTVINDGGEWKHVSPDEAWAHYQKTGEFLGKFDTVEEANNFAEKLHQYEEYKIKNESSTNKPQIMATPDFVKNKKEAEYDDEYWENVYNEEFARIEEELANDPVGFPAAARATAKVWKMEDTQDYIDEYAEKKYDDDFWGQTAASYRRAAIAEKKGDLYNDYYNSGSEGDLQLAKNMSELAANFELNNYETLRDDATLPWVSQSLAGYAPQLIRQTGARALGGLTGGFVGAAAGNPVAGAAVGQAMASSADMYQSMRGQIFGELLEMGVDEETARKAASDEAVVSSAIEGVDALGDAFTFGRTSLLKALGKGTIKGTVKGAGKELFKTLLKYGINIGQEYGEEWLQEGVSIANERRTQTGQTGKSGLAGDSAKVAWGAITGTEDRETRSRMHEAGTEGAKIATMMGLVPNAINVGINARNMRVESNVGKVYDVNEVITEGLKLDNNSEAHIIAENLQAKQWAGKKITNAELVEAVRANAQEIQREESKAQPATDEEAADGRANDLETDRTGGISVDNTVVDNLPANPKKAVAEFAKTVDKAGATVLTEMYGAETDPIGYIRDMMKVYSAGRKGADISTVEGVESINPAQIKAMYTAGVSDARPGVSAIDNAGQIAYTESTDMEDSIYGEEVHLRNGGEWIDGADTAGGLPGVEESARRNPSRQETSRPADGEAASLTYGEKISSSEWSITGGTQNKTIYPVVSGETKATQKARQYAESRGLNLRLFGGGNIEVVVRDQNGVDHTVIARALIDGENVYVRADHPDFDAYQLVRHEGGHDKIDRGEINPDDVRERVATSIEKEKLDGLCHMYVEAYTGSNLKPQEVWVEVICDSEGDMNIFKGSLRENDARELIDEVKKAVSATSKEAKETRGPPAVKTSRESGEIGDSERGHYDGREGETLDSVEKDSIRSAEMEKGTWSSDRERRRGRTGGAESGRGRLEQGELSNYEKLRLAEMLVSPVDASPEWRLLIKDFSIDKATEVLLDWVITDNPLAKELKTYVPGFTRAVEKTYDFLNRERYNSLGASKDKATLNSGEVVSEQQNSDAEKITEAQAEYFKNSKFRDEKGRLLVLYHGSSMEAFSIFDVYAGVWMSTNREYAETYAGEWKYPNRRETLSEELYGDEKMRVFKLYANAENPMVLGEIDAALDKKKLQEFAKTLNVATSVLEDIANEYDGDKIFVLTRSHEFMELAKKQGYDSFIATESGVDTYCVFKHPNQVALVSNKTPTRDPDIRFSRDIDVAGNELSAEQAEYFKDSKVRDDKGNLKIMYRGGNETYTEFDRKKASHSNLYGRGMYFSDSEAHAKTYGDVRAFYLNVTDPVSTTERTITRGQMKKFLEVVSGNEDYSFENYGYGATVSSVLDSVFTGKSDFAMLYDVSLTAIGDMVETGKLFNEVNGTTYDGLILDTETVIFDSEQAKFIDNKNPSTSKDFRFSYELEELGQLRDENNALRNRLEYWKGQTKRTVHGEETLRQGDANKLSKRIIESYDSTLSTSDIATDIKSLGEYIVRSDNPDWNEVKNRAVGIANKVVNSASVLTNDSELETWKEIKKDIRSRRLNLTEKSDIPDFNDFRKRNIGKFIISNDGTPVDTVYKELTELYGEAYFPSAITHPAEQLMHIAEVIDRMEPVYANPYSYNMAVAVESVANDIIDGLFSRTMRLTPPTFADRQAAKLAATKEAGARKLEALREKKNAKIEEVRRKGVQRAKQALQKVRSDRDAKIADLKEHFRLSKAKASESRKASALRKKIANHTKELSNKLLHPTDKNHIPHQMQGPLARLLEAINLESNFEMEYGTDAKYHRVERGAALGAEPTKRTAAFAEVKKALSEVSGELVIDPDLLGDGVTPGLFDEVIALGDKRIADMSLKELDTVWQSVRAIEAAVRSANKMFASAKYAYVSEFAEAIREDNAGKKDKSELNYGLGTVKNLVTLDSLTPETYFHFLGDAGDAIFRIMRNAQDKHISIMKDVSEFTQEKLKRVKIAKLENDAHDVILGGKNVKLSTAQLMELYVLMRREQAKDHILTGGILPDTVKGKGIKQKAQSRAARGVTLEEISAAISHLSPEQVAIAEALQEYASTTLSKYGNEASMAVYNYEKFNEPFYWPIRVNRQEVKSTTEKDTAVTSVANRGFTKATKPNSQTSVSVGSIFDTFATHTSEMATYAAWLGATEDINRIRNFVFRDASGVAVETVKEIVERVHGKKGNAYLNKLLSDVANGIKGTHSETDYMSGRMGNYMASAIGANIRVIVQQPTTLIRALDMIGPQYLFVPGNPISGWKKALKYAPIAQWKDWGYFDINTGKQMKDILFEQSFGQKAKDAAMWGASAMDSLAWGQIWNAAEAETKAKLKAKRTIGGEVADDIKAGSAEFYKAVAERFTEIIDHTQVVDGIMQRSQIMRSSNSAMKMATSFMGEPTKQVNMLASALYDAKHKKSKKATARLARTTFVLILGAVLNAAAQSFADATRDDDKEKKYWEKWLSAFTGITGEEKSFGDYFESILSGNVGNAMNPLQYIPFGRDVVSLAQGYDVERMDVAPVANAITALQHFWKAINGEGKYTVAGASAEFFAEGARFFGVPVANLKRDIKAAIMTYANETDNYLLQYRMEKAFLDLNYSGNKKAFLDILYNAYVDDDEAYDIIYKDMIKSGFEEKKIKDAMETRMKKDAGVEKVDELKNRYLPPDQQSRYDDVVDDVKGGKIWNRANKAQRDAALDALYDIVTGSDSGEKMQAIIDGGASYGVSEEDYILYRLALSTVDEPTKGGKYGTYTQAEAEKALDLLGLDDDASGYLWQTTNNNWSAKKNPYN